MFEFIKKNATATQWVLIFTCFIGGTLAVILSRKQNTPIEQAAEAVLRTQGIDIDFSAWDN